METIAVVQTYVDQDVPEFDWKRRNDKLAQHSSMSLQMYADKHGYDYYLFTDQKYPGYHPQLEIFRVLDMDYDRIITVDADVIVRDTNQDIIEHSHPTGLSACWRPDGGDNINSGVLVWGRDARNFYRSVVDIDRAASMKNRDQDEINLINQRYPAHRMTSKFNDYTLSPISYWWHYKGGMKNEYSSSR